MNHHHVPPNSGVASSDMRFQPQRLLLLGCSKAKSSHEGLLPALHRYDGPAFRVVRKYLRQRDDDTLRIVILSAEFGLIPADLPIPNYNRRMTPLRAQELEPQVTSTMNKLLKQILDGESDPKAVIVHLGKDYLRTLGGIDPPLLNSLRDRTLKGPQGHKLSLLYSWLYGSPPAITVGSETMARSQRIRGIDLHLTPTDVLNEARHALRDDGGKANQVHAWSVEVDGQLVAVKWLVARITGLPVSSFTTTEACSLLARIGVEAMRV